MNDLGKVFDDVVRDKVRAVPDKARVIEEARRSGRLLAVRGSMDYIEKVLPHCYASEKVVLEPTSMPPVLTDFDVVFVGCPGHINTKAWSGPLYDFLELGGILVTTDWCLGNLIEPIFPGMIRNVGSASGTFPLSVRQPNHPLLEGVEGIEKTPWVVEGASHRIAVVNTARVEVVLDAPKMGEPSAILVAFQVGQGLVIHAVSHFHLQGSETKGHYVSAFLLTNIIDEAMRRRRPAKSTSRIQLVPKVAVDPSKLRVRLVDPKR
jgi:hypothetical protein